MLICLTDIYFMRERGLAISRYWMAVIFYFFIYNVVGKFGENFFGV